MGTGKVAQCRGPQQIVTRMRGYNGFSILRKSSVVQSFAIDPGLPVGHAEKGDGAVNCCQNRSVEGYHLHRHIGAASDGGQTGELRPHHLAPRSAAAASTR